MSLCARESASRTAKPSSRSMAATALLPLAMPPVRPRRNIAISPRPGYGFRCVCFGFAAPETRRFNGIAHQHGDSHGADATGDRREGAGYVNCVGMNVADERAAFGLKFF